ncbi:DUF2628 domain-containing protein [Persephonella sp.]|nr:DUF2628 domain-containing protein [Aquificota bacterium]
MDKWEKYRLFIGKNADYYIQRFKKFEETGGALSWNWPAFFFGIVWMLYRKMYLYGLIAFLAGGILGMMIAVMSPGNMLLAAGVQLWLMIGFGAFGNYIYYYFVKNQVQRLENLYHDPEELKRALESYGGTNMVAPLLYLLIIFILQIITIKSQ